MSDLLTLTAIEPRRGYMNMIPDFQERIRRFLTEFFGGFGERTSAQ